MSNSIRWNVGTTVTSQVNNGALPTGQLAVLQYVYPQQMNPIFSIGALGTGSKRQLR